NPASASTLIVSGISSPRAAGVPSNLTVEVRDSFGNRVTGYAGTVTFVSSDGQAALPPNYTFTSADAGIHTFGNVTLKTAGTQFVRGTDTGNSSITGAETGIVVNPAASTTLIVSGIASPRTAGVTSNLTVEVRDNFGN